MRRLRLRFNETLLAVMALLLTATFVSCSNLDFFKKSKFGVTCQVSRTDSRTLPVQEPLTKGMPNVEFSCGPIVIFAQEGAAVISLDAARIITARKVEDQRQQLALLKNDIRVSKDEQAEIVAALTERSRGADPLDERRRNIMEEEKRKLVSELMMLEDQVTKTKRSLDSSEEDNRKLRTFSLPADATTLTQGNWTLGETGYVFRSVSQYRPEKRLVIPYVIQDKHGNILEIGSVEADYAKQESD